MNISATMMMSKQRDAVAQDHHNGAERRDRNFGLIAPSKQHQMAEARRRTEKVETKSNAR
jgi:hypothetical protein